MSQKAAGDFLIEQIENEINLALVFTAASRRAYSLQQVEAGDAALQKAQERYTKAVELATELAEKDLVRTPQSA
jgi:hypothetical protein